MIVIATMMILLVKDHPRVVKVIRSQSHSPPALQIVQSSSITAVIPVQNVTCDVVTVA